MAPSQPLTKAQIDKLAAKHGISPAGSRLLLRP